MPNEIGSLQHFQIIKFVWELFWLKKKKSYNRNQEAPDSCAGFKGKYVTKASLNVHMECDWDQYIKTDLKET